MCDCKPSHDVCRGEWFLKWRAHVGQDKWAPLLNGVPRIWDSGFSEASTPSSAWGLYQASCVGAVSLILLRSISFGPHEPGSRRISAPEEGVKGSGASVQGSAQGFAFDLLACTNESALMCYFDWTGLNWYEPQLGHILTFGILLVWGGHRITWAWSFPGECKSRRLFCFGSAGWGSRGWRSQTTEHIELSPMLSCKDFMCWKQRAGAWPHLVLFLKGGKGSAGGCVFPSLIDNNCVDRQILAPWGERLIPSHCRWKTWGDSANKKGL